MLKLDRGQLCNETAIALSAHNNELRGIDNARFQQTLKWMIEAIKNEEPTEIGNALELLEQMYDQES